jgi:hypothetical protein
MLIDNQRNDKDLGGVENTKAELVVDSIGQSLEYNPSESDDKILIE